MPYIKRSTKRRECQLPYILFDGEIYECDDCGQQWKSHYPGNPEYTRWSKVWFRRKKPRERQ
jgi:hypothetical protein